MTRVHPVENFIGGADVTTSAPPCYCYSGYCPQTGAELRLPRTAQAEAIARGLMQQLAAEPTRQEGKMYGVLLIETSAGEQGVLKAFSGLLHGQSVLPGWVPPIPGRTQVTLAETQTLARLDQLKQRLTELINLPARQEADQIAQDYGDRLQALAEEHRRRKQARDRRRAACQEKAATLSAATMADLHNQLIRQSQQDGRERRRLKQARDRELAPLRAAIAQADAEITQIKQQRKTLSRRLQVQLHAAYSLFNFAGNVMTLQALLPEGMPTGTGACAAPKLLHYAASQGFKPVAMAEFWWGPSSGDKRAGQFYGACADRCQPIMGFLLSGLPSKAAVAVPEASPAAPAILYEDDFLLVVEKPTNLLSVPGRTSELQDSVLSRLRCQRGNAAFLKAAHRLDKGTSGLLLLAKTPAAHRALGQQFAQRQVQKTYEALLSRPLAKDMADSGVIDLPLARNLSDRPKQSVDRTRGKQSLTEFQILQHHPHPRIQFRPHTGRTHQLRVHAAHPEGLNSPILGDSLYGLKTVSIRLHLHASALKFVHPVTQKTLEILSPMPF